MINGISPLLIFTWKKEDGTSGIPIPIYLDEDLTKIQIDETEESLTINTETLADVDDENKIKIVQKGLTQKATVSTILRDDSIVGNILLPLLKTIASKVLTNLDYNIAYIDKSILIFESKLVGYQKKQSREDNLVRLSIELEVKPEEKKKEEVKTLPKYEGDMNLPAGTNTVNASQYQYYELQNQTSLNVPYVSQSLSLEGYKTVEQTSVKSGSIIGIISEQKYFGIDTAQDLAISNNALFKPSGSLLMNNAGQMFFGVPKGLVI